MTVQSGAPAATQVSRLVDLSGNPLGTNTNGLYVTPTGTILETLPAPTLVNLVAPRTDIVTVNLPDITCPAFTVALFIVRTTAVSGTGPSMTVSVQSKDSQGVYSTANGGNNFTALATVTAAVLAFSASGAGSATLLGPIFRIQATITGTTPSFTWYVDMFYK